MSERHDDEALEEPAGLKEGIAAYRNPEKRERWVPLFVALIKSRRLTDGDVRLWALIASYADRGREGRSGRPCFAGQARLAHELGVKEREIRRRLTVLKQAGLLTVEQRGQGEPNYYWVEDLTPASLLWLSGPGGPDQGGPPGPTT
jgi:DNA-binding transcriptional ArsR family regulator